MSAPDRSWTIAPTLLWFGALLTAALVAFDGGVQAIADRLSAKRPAQQPTGPAFTGPPPVVAEADDTDVAAQLPPPAGSHDNHDLGALDDTCLDGPGGDAACKHWAMDAFYAAVASEKKGTLGRAVRVSWYGDSVIANDAIPGRLRKQLQGELGDGGPGFVFAVPPHRFNEHEAITRSVGGTWALHAISMTPTPDGLYGPGGATAETFDGGRSTIKLVAGRVTSLELYYLAQPHGGTVTIRSGGAELVHADTAADQKAPGFAAATTTGVAKLDLDTRGKVRLFGLTLENGKGAVVDNLGVVSVNVKSWQNADADHWSAELAHRGADLVLVMLGANEAQWLAPGDQDTKDYQGRYEKVLAPIRKGRPDASCLVVSPTDQAESRDGDYVSRPVMPLLVDAQRKAAHAQGCAFFSTYDWMGGKGSAAKWFRKGLVGSDFQHLTQKGANKLADGLFDALMTGAQRYASH
jgi:lysophospholipase L1-like esterase